jgi:hypothetical protein
MYRAHDSWGLEMAQYSACSLLVLMGGGDGVKELNVGLPVVYVPDLLTLFRLHRTSLVVVTLLLLCLDKGSI